MPGRKLTLRQLAVYFAVALGVGIHRRGLSFISVGFALVFTLLLPLVLRLLRWLPEGYFRGPDQPHLPGFLFVGWMWFCYGILHWGILPEGIFHLIVGTTILALCVVHIAVARRRARNPASVQRHIVDLS